LRIYHAIQSFSVVFLYDLLEIDFEFADEFGAVQRIGEMAERRNLEIFSARRIRPLRALVETSHAMGFHGSVFRSDEEEEATAETFDFGARVETLSYGSDVLRRYACRGSDRRRTVDGRLQDDPQTAGESVGDVDADFPAERVSPQDDVLPVDALLVDEPLEDGGRGFVDQFFRRTTPALAEPGIVPGHDVEAQVSGEELVESLVEREIVDVAVGVDEVFRPLGVEEFPSYIGVDEPRMHASRCGLILSRVLPAYPFAFLN